MYTYPTKKVKAKKNITPLQIHFNKQNQHFLIFFPTVVIVLSSGATCNIYIALLMQYVALHAQINALMAHRNV